MKKQQLVFVQTRIDKRVRDQLRAHAKRRGMSFSAYLRALLDEETKRPEGNWTLDLDPAK